MANEGRTTVRSAKPAATIAFAARRPQGGNQNPRLEDGTFEMKATLALLAIAISCVGMSACGSAGANHPRKTSSSTPVTGHFENDGDNDVIGDADEDNGNDNDNDPSADDRPNDNLDYHDSDDFAILDSGHPADAADRQAVTIAVKRYYAAAAAQDATEACRLMDPAYASALPEDYGGGPGPAYLRGAKTCAAVLSLVFKRAHRQLQSTIEVTGVRVNGGHALALLGSATMPASYANLERKQGTWRIDTLIGDPLP
jgi:hypothetical protein